MSIIFSDKPAGATTHSSGKPERAVVRERIGWAEYLSARLGQDLLVVHRLDRGTTGVLAFAQTPPVAEQLRELFSRHQVQKSYQFLTDRPCRQKKLTVHSVIERRGSEFVSTVTEPSKANAQTELEFVDEQHGISLWQARPLSGKPHQIRLHAESVGLPILGDLEHGGTRAPVLCLHSAQIEFQLNGTSHHTEAPAPIWFRERRYFADAQLMGWLAAIDRRERILRSLGQSPIGQTLRWIHTEGDPLRVDQLGDVFCMSWYQEREPSTAECAKIQELAALMGWHKWYLAVRENRGRSPQAEAARPAGPVTPETRWQAQENGLSFEFRADSGLSPGLFLDQRRNRAWIREQCRAARVLNLFCYTGGFSVAAAKGGAKQVVSVDISKSFLEWTKQNFAINQLSLEGHEFRAIDTRVYLNWAAKKQLKFDLIVCDPPSFGRSKDGVFRISDDLPELLRGLVNVCAPGGQILFTTNFEQWSEEKFHDLVRRELAAQNRRDIEVELTPAPDWDFELPGEAPLMKGLILRM